MSIHMSVHMFIPMSVHMSMHTSMHRPTAETFASFLTTIMTHHQACGVCHVDQRCKYRHCRIIARSLYIPSLHTPTVTVHSLHIDIHGVCILNVRPLHGLQNHSTATVRPRCSGCAITVRPRFNHCRVTAQSLRSHCFTVAASDQQQ